MRAVNRLQPVGASMPPKKPIKPKQPKKDVRKGGFIMIRLAPPYPERLRALAARNHRTLTAEALLAFDAHFAANGV